MNWALLLIVIVKMISGGATKVCENPDQSIKQPRNAKSNAFNHPYRWVQNYVISYRCFPGYRFPDGAITKYTKCISNRFSGLQWSITSFSDCHDYCAGNTCHFGRCVFDFKQKKYGCKCFDHYGGSMCQKVVCDIPSNVSNGSHNGTLSYIESLRGVPVGTEVQYTCKPGYRLLGAGNIKCMAGGIYFPSTPRCVNSTHKYFCEREYNRPSLQETTLYKHAILTNSIFLWRSSVGFSCRPNQHLVDYNNQPFRGITTCQLDGTWSRQWPMCKVKTCKNPDLHRGTYKVYHDQNGFYVDGVSRVLFKCYHPFFLYGERYATCVGGKWSASPECFTLQAFKNQCLLDDKIVEFQGYNRSEPVCLKPVIVEDEEAAKRQLKTITVVTSTAAVLFGVLLMIVAGVAFQRRRLLSRIRRFQEQLTEERDRANIDNDVYMRFVLPSYDEAEQNKPTTRPPTFDEAQRDAEQGEQQEQADGATAVLAPSFSPIQDPAPPPYELLHEEETFGNNLNLTCVSSSSEESLDNGVYLDDATLL